MTSKNKPKVTNVAGSVKNINTGFTKILSKLSTTATIMADGNPFT